LIEGVLSIVSPIGFEHFDPAKAGMDIETRLKTTRAAKIYLDPLFIDITPFD
jgi:hypothetical protein